ncbi:MAG: phosphatidate cytidylyltransferase [Bacteroidaceae bacterium]|nr:phosphatidate cytidylyltransferase [Bacteroidaceae bacterium]
MKSFIIRTATGIVFVGTLLAAMLYSNITFGILFALIAGLAVNEFCNIIQEYKKTTFSTLLAVLGGIYLFFLFFASTNLNIGNITLLSLPYILLVVYIFVRELYRKEGGALDNFAYFCLSQVYAAIPFALLNIPATYNGTYHYILPLAIFVFLWSNDSGAYCIGCLFGKHKMFKRISPKKSWEGFAGGTAVAIIAGFIMSQFFDILSTWQWMTMAAVVVAAGTLGDLIESCMKREAKIKDSGNILPGHGGILDRFDSFILATPCVVIFLYLL